MGLIVNVLIAPVSQEQLPALPPKTNVRLLQWLLSTPERWCFALPLGAQGSPSRPVGGALLKEAPGTAPLRESTQWKQGQLSGTGLPAILPTFQWSQKSQCNQALDTEVPPSPWGECNLYDLGGWDDSGDLGGCLSPQVKQDSAGGCVSQPGLGGPALLSHP